MEDQKSQELIQKYIDGLCTPEEIALVNSWYNERSNTIKDELPEPDYDFWHKRISANLPEAKATISIWPKYTAAAAILLILVAGIFYFSTYKPLQTQIAVANTQKKIVPGKNAATLTLANGKKIILSEITNGEISKSAGVSIVKSADGQIIYEVNKDGAATDEINTLSTANGETYRINLPDGTMVWLNAASSLKYTATLIKSGNRSVELSGEGYFEVAKDRKHPFIVKTANQEVTVLGTHFNISAYAEDSKTLTTLMEGSVKVSRNAAQKILNPGQQSLLSNNIFSVKEVEADDVIAWKNGLFLFNDEPLEDIMKKIARWYDVEVVYQNIDKQKTFWGGVSRYDDITKVLDKLELTGGVHFKIEGRRIIVTK